MENLYLATCSHLAVAKRTKVVNEKLGFCLEVMEMINNHLTHEHSSRQGTIKLRIWKLGLRTNQTLGRPFYANLDQSVTNLFLNPILDR